MLSVFYHLYCISSLPLPPNHFIIASQSCELIDSLSCKTGLSGAYESSKCLTKLQPLRQHLSFQISFSFYTINKATGKTMGVTLNTYWGTQNKPDLCVAWRPDQEALAALLVSRSKIKVGKIMLLYKEWLFFFHSKAKFTPWGRMSIGSYWAPCWDFYFISAFEHILSPLIHQSYGFEWRIIFPVKGGRNELGTLITHETVQWTP